MAIKRAKIIAASERPYATDMKSSYVNDIEDYLIFLGLKEYPVGDGVDKQGELSYGYILHG